MTRVAFITVGDPDRLTGGYLYHRQVFARLPGLGIGVEQVVAGGAGLEEQLARAAAFGAAFDPRPYDVVAVDALARAVVAPWLDAWRAARPLLAMVHELPSAAGAARDPAELGREAPLLRADALVAVSDDGAGQLAARGAPRERIVVAPGGFDRLPTLGAPPRRPGGLRALCVAQWTPRKGLVELCRAWSAIARPGDSLTLVGEQGADEGYAAEVRAAIAAAPPGAILAPGPLSDAELAAAYAGADLFALPSRFEGYGIVYAEAMARGLPVVACAVGPVPALVGDAGLLVAPGDAAALAAALARLTGDAGLRAAMGAAARARAAGLPTWDDTAARFAAAVRLAALRAAAGPGPR